MTTLFARDLSPLADLKRADEDWLQRLTEHVRAPNHVVRLGAALDEPEPIVSRSFDGRWRAGRYIGAISFEGRRLEIEPRLAPEALRELLRAALNVVIPMRSGALERTSAIVPLLLALVWCRELDSATRHGLPFLRRPVSHEGLFVRGRVQERRTRELRRRGVLALASTSGERSLDNDIVKTLVCGHRALTRMLGSDSWMTPRAIDVMPHLWGAVGSRPRLPSALEVGKIRYTPIRRPYRALVNHSWEVAQGRGLRGAGEGSAEGLLIDMAEIWERYVLHCVKRASSTVDEVSHEALGSGRDRYLYQSMATPSVVMGRLLPDTVVSRNGRPIAVVDAKYKLIHDRLDAPQGVAREDRFQLAGYLSALGIRELVGMLAFPVELDDRGHELVADEQSKSSAEAHNPWKAPSRTTAYFSRISFNPVRAISQVREVLMQAGGGKRNG